MNIVDRLARRRMVGAAVLSGCAAALALPSWSLWPLGLLGLAAFAALAAKAPDRRAAFGRGWAFGVGFFGLGLYWIGFSFGNRDPGLVWMAPFAIAALAGGLALFTALVAVAIRALRAAGLCFPLGFAGVWTLGEFARGLLFTGFPWNLAAHAIPPGSIPSQAAAYVGVYGLSFAVAALAGGFALFAWRLPVAAGVWVAGVGALVVAAGWSRPPAPPIAADAPLIRVVQPNIPQRDKWVRDLRGAHFANLLDLSSAPADRPVRLVVWPETSAPFDIAADDAARRVVAGRALAAGSAALIGSPRRGPDGRVRNSLVAIDAGGAPAVIYDKHHLVPFGEYVPFGDLLSFGGLAGGGFSPGPGPQLIDAGGLRISPLICYEVIFPRYADGGAGATRPDLLVNVTNDAWFDDSPGPRQHAVAAAYRAIEQGVPLVRSANTGISLITDARGATLSALDFGARGVVDHPQPTALATPPPIAAAPLAIPFILALVGIGVAGVAATRAR